MCPPTQLGRLHALGYETFDRPGVDERPVRLGIARALRVAFGDVDALDAGALHQLGPAVAGAGLVGRDAEVAHHIEQRVLDHPGDHARIGTAAAHRRDAAGPPPAQLEHAFAQRIVRACRRRQGAVGVQAGPGLDHRVDVERVDVLGEIHELDRGRIDRQVHDQTAPGPGREQGREDVAIVRLGQRHMNEAELALVQKCAVVVVRRDHRELGGIEGDVPLQERQRAPADRAEPDHHDGAVEAGVHRPDFGRMGNRAHASHPRVRPQKAQAARGASVRSLPERPAMPAAEAVFVRIRPVARTSPCAPSSAPGTSSQASSRSRA